MRWVLSGVVGVLCVVAAGVASYAFWWSAAPPSPAQPLDKLELLAWLDGSAFARLDKTLNRLQAEIEQGARPEWHVQHAFEAFASTDPAIPQRVERWRAAFPDSFAPRLALAIHLNHRAWLKRGSSYAGGVQPEQWRAFLEDAGAAITAAREAIALRPRLTEGYAELIYLLNATSARDEALAVVRQGLSVAPASVLVHKAHLWLQMPEWGGDIGQLAGAIQQILQEFPDDQELRALAGQANLLIAKQLRERGNYEAALDYIRDARQVGARFPVEEGDLLLQLGRPAEALLAYGEALDQWPGRVEAHRGIAALLERTPASVALARETDLLLALDPLNPDFLTLRARELDRTGQRAEALHDYEQALIYGAYAPQVLVDAGAFLVTVPGRREAAISALNRALLLAPGDATLTARVSGALGRVEDCSLLPQFDALLERYLEQCRRGADCPNLEFNRQNWSFMNDNLRRRCSQGPVDAPGTMR